MHATAQVRITGACPLSILDENGWSEDMIVQCVTAAARHGAALSINHSPWFLHYGPNDAPDCCPDKEAAEMTMYTSRLAQTRAWINTANQRLGSNVSVTAVLLDAERWTVKHDNASWNAAVTRKHTLMYNATTMVFPSAVLEWYDRGGYMYDGMGTGFMAPSPYFALDEPGATFSTSLYGLGQVGYTRAQYAQTVALTANHSVTTVTPWVALGCGMAPTFQLQGFSMNYSYPLINSWMIGRDVNIPGPFPQRIVGCDGGFGHAPRVAMYPAVLSGEGAVVGDTTQILQHFVAYVLGANCLQMLPNATTATQGWSWGVLKRGPVTGPTGCYL